MYENKSYSLLKMENITWGTNNNDKALTGALFLDEKNQVASENPCLNLHRVIIMIIFPFFFFWQSQIKLNGQPWKQQIK